MEMKSVDHGLVHGAAEGAMQHLQKVEEHVKQAVETKVKADAGYVHSHLASAAKAVETAVTHTKDVLERPFTGMGDTKKTTPAQVQAPPKQEVKLAGQSTSSHVLDVLKYAGGALLAIAVLVWYAADHPAVKAVVGH